MLVLLTAAAWFSKGLLVNALAQFLSVAKPLLNEDASVGLNSSSLSSSPLTSLAWFLYCTSLQ